MTGVIGPCTVRSISADGAEAATCVTCAVTDIPSMGENDMPHIEDLVDKPATEEKLTEHFSSLVDHIEEMLDKLNATPEERARVYHIDK